MNFRPWLSPLTLWCFALLRSSRGVFVAGVPGAGTGETAVSSAHGALGAPALPVRPPPPAHPGAVPMPVLHACQAPDTPCPGALAVPRRGPPSTGEVVPEAVEWPLLLQGPAAQPEWTLPPPTGAWRRAAGGQSPEVALHGAFARHGPLLAKLLQSTMPPVSHQKGTFLLYLLCLDLLPLLFPLPTLPGIAPIVNVWTYVFGLVLSWCTLHTPLMNYYVLLFFVHIACVLSDFVCTSVCIKYLLSVNKILFATWTHQYRHISVKIINWEGG